MSTLGGEFHLDRERSLGARIQENLLALRDFGAKFKDLDTAIGNTDLDSIATAVHDLKQIQLAVLRVEGAVVEMAGTSQVAMEEMQTRPSGKYRTCLPTKGRNCAFGGSWMRVQA